MPDERWRREGVEGRSGRLKRRKSLPIDAGVASDWALPARLGL